MAEISGTESSKAASFTSSLASKGIHNSPGPFIGIVKNNVDPSRSGKLQVWISEMGGKHDDAGSWLTVSYCTPFYGVTPPEKRSSGQSFSTNPHSYGMWFVPPDIGVKVLVTFIDGNKYKGYWFGCIPEWPNMHMVPGLSGPVDKKSPYPVVEYNDTGSSDNGITQFFKRAETKHDVQSATYQKQGLLQDPLRGPGTSSAFRETPSRVFGISTPGAPLSEQDQSVVSDTGTVELDTVGRRGGHTFVMDDGDAQGKNRQFKMRSSTGHTILMSDTGGFIYIINAAGTAWIEMDAQGSVNVYSGAQIQLSANSGINIDSKGAVKIHGKTVDIKSDGPVNIEGKDVNVKAAGSAKMSGGKDVHIKGAKALVTGDTCLSLSGGTHVDIGGACIKLGVAASKASPAGGATAPQQMPSKEPWAGHKGGAAGSSNPTAQPSYASTVGLPGGTGTYGAANNFGSSTVQQNYAELPNNIGPVKYNDGLQGSFSGQATTYNTAVNTPSISAADIANFGRYSLPPTVSGIYDNTSTSYKTISPIMNMNYQSGSTFDAGNLIGSAVNDIINTAGMSFTEKQNNPGKLAYVKSDIYAIGNANGFAVYLKPEDGIAAMMVEFDQIQSRGYTTPTNMIAQYFKIQNSNAGDVVNATRFISNMTGINPSSYVDLSNARYRMAWANATIQFLQGHMSYTYDQVVVGCAMSRGISASSFVNTLTNGINPYASGTGFPGTATYVPVTTPQLIKGGSSITGQIVAGIANTVVNKVINTALGTVTNTVSNVVNNAVTGSYGVVSGTMNNVLSSGSTGTNYTIGDINGIIGSRTLGPNTECTSLVQGVFPGVGYASNWQGTGTSVISDPPATGTAIAAGFNNGGYYGTPGSPGGASGQTHAAIITGYVDANKNPLPINPDTGKPFPEDTGKIAGFTCAEQYNASGGVIRSQTYMTNGTGGTKDAASYQPIVVNGQQFTKTTTPFAAKNTETAPNPATNSGINEDQGNATKPSVTDEKDLTKAGTATKDVGTATKSPDNLSTERGNTQAQIAEADQKIATGSEISKTQTQLIDTNKQIIADNKTQAQELRNQQAENTAQQRAVQEKYDNGKLTDAEYKSQMNPLVAQNQSLGSKAAKLENEAKDLTSQNEKLTADRDLTDAKVLDAQEQKSALLNSNQGSAGEIDSKEQAQATNQSFESKQVTEADAKSIDQAEQGSYNSVPGGVVVTKDDYGNTIYTHSPDSSEPVYNAQGEEVAQEYKSNLLEPADKLPVEFSPAADNRPASTFENPAGDTFGPDTTTIASRDNFIPNTTNVSQGGGEEYLAGQPTQYEAPNPTQSTVDGNEYPSPASQSSTTVTVNDDYGNPMNVTTNGGGPTETSAFVKTDYSSNQDYGPTAPDMSGGGVRDSNNATTEGVTGGNAGSPISGSAGAPGTGSAAAGGAAAVPGGTAATAPGAASC